MSGTFVNEYDPRLLHPHPKNAEIYEAFGPGHPEWQGLFDSIATSGVMQPCIIIKGEAENYVVISGHRRVQICLAQLDGNSNPRRVPCLVHHEMDFESIEKALIESNRYRKKTLSEIVREAQALGTIEAELAKARQGTRTDIGAILPESSGRSADKVADTLGVSRRTLDKMEAIHEAAKTSPHIAEALNRLDRGESSIEATYQKVRILEAGDRPPFEPKVYDHWAFGSLDPRYGQPHPGSVPGALVENAMYYFAADEGPIVDPFAGGGITVDVCRLIGRECVASDLAPARPDILPQDIRAGFLPQAAGAALIFLDPPYWNMIAEDYVEDSVSSLSLSDFVLFLQKLFVDCVATLRPGGCVTYLSLKSKFRLPVGVEMIDWPLMAAQLMAKAGLMAVDRICVQWPTSVWQPFHVTWAKKEKKILPVCGDMVVYRRLREED